MLIKTRQDSLQAYKDDIFEQAFRNMTRGMEDHEFKHYNVSMGCQIYNKEHYKAEMKRRNMVPYDEMERLASEWDKKNKRKEYGDLTPGALDIINSLKLTADKNGNLVLGSRAIKALKEIGAIGNTEHIPEGALTGGFSG